MAARVVVVGSINVDLVVSADRLPVAGQTVLGGRYAEHQGGKGANAAVAAARAGAEVAMIGAVGQDRHGETALAALVAEGVDVSAVRRDAEPTGVALIAVARHGENLIVVAPGANAALRSEEIGALDGLWGDVLLTNHEVPMPVVIAALEAARGARMTAILNPAPAQALPPEVVTLAPILTPNEHELIVISGNEEADAGLDDLAERTGAPVIVTQGSRGAILAHGNRRERFRGYRAPGEVDTTGAGDTFSGCLAAWLAHGSSLEEAIRAGNAAAALSVAAAGAREGMPYREAILQFLESQR
jgi:ribokinase